MHKTIIATFLMFILAIPTAFSQEKETVSGNNSVVQSKPSLELFEKLGSVLASDPFQKFELRTDEKRALIRGFIKGLDKPLSKEEAQKWAPKIREMLKPKLVKQQQKKKVEEKKESIAKNTSFPMDQSLRQSNGEATSVSRLVKGQKAVLLSFWSTSSQSSTKLLKHLKKVSEILKPEGIVCAAINIENDVEKSEAFRKTNKIKYPFFVDSKDSPLTKLLGVKNIPHVLLINPEGEFLYNGLAYTNELDKAIGALRKPIPELSKKQP